MEKANHFSVFTRVLSFNLMKIAVILVLASFQVSGQTFNYIESFELTNTDDRDELCLTIYNNRVFIQDEGDDEVDVYSATSPFSYIDNFGEAQFGNSEDGIAVYNGLIFVVDDDDDNIEVFDVTDYSFVAQINTSAEVGDIEGILIAFNKLFVVDDNNGVNVFNANSPYDFITEFGNAQLVEPAGITVYGNHVYVVDEDNDDIHVFNGINYSYITSFGSGIAYGEGITTICDYILVLEDEGDEGDYVDVYMANPPYSYVTSFGIGQIGDSECIAVSGNLIYVVDSGDNEIDIFEFVEGCEPIPTLSQWGLILLGLCLSITGLVALKTRYFTPAHSG